MFIQSFWEHTSFYQKLITPLPGRPPLTSLYASKKIGGLITTVRALKIESKQMKEGIRG